MCGVSRRLGFWSVAFAFAAVMAYSAVPAPLYSLYDFSSLTITLVFSAYAVGVVGGLFLAGHVSDWYGRRTVLVPALVLALVSGIFFLAFRDAGGLAVGRFLNGISVGAVTATATAWLQELHSGTPRRAQGVATGANLGGIGSGPLLAGVLAQWVAAPLTVPYVVSLALIALALVLVALTPETRTPLRPRPRYRPQRVSVPPADRGVFFAACAAAAIPFAGFGLFTSLAPSFLAGTLDHPSRALAGLAAFIAFGAGVAAQLATPTARRASCWPAGSWPSSSASGCWSPRSGCPLPASSCSCSAASWPAAAAGCCSRGRSARWRRWPVTRTARRCWPACSSAATSGCPCR